MKLDEGRARDAFAPLAKALRLTVADLAEATVRLVNSNMERAIRVISVQRGHDPRDFTLVSFGGAGGLHACDLAAELSIPRVLFPVMPGVLSAWGAACADRARDYSRTVMLRSATEAEIDAGFAPLEERARKDFSGRTARTPKLRAFLDLRYAGQSYELTVPHGAKLAATVARFHEAHRKRYGHASPGHPVEIVTLRMRAAVATPRPRLPAIAKARSSKPDAARIAHQGGVATFDRALLRAGHSVPPRSRIVEDYSTSFIPAGWRAKVDALGNILAEQD